MAIDQLPPPKLRPRQVIGRESLNLPNLVTVSRLFLAVVLFALIDSGQWWMTCAVLFVVAVSTDALDGWLARRHGQVTVLGRILDPFVDKIIVGGAFLFLLDPTGDQDTGVNPWMVIIVIGREMFVSSLRGILEQQGRDFSASFSGKAKMVLQSVAVTAVLVSLAENFHQPWIIPVRRRSAVAGRDCDCMEWTDLRGPRNPTVAVVECVSVACPADFPEFVDFDGSHRPD